tara:strand:+ start:2074 stop:2928 length:855 start_codon:yes stop_codon:yes gene_type:complete
MEKNIIKYNLDNLDRSMLYKQSFLVQKGIQSYTYINEFPLKNLNSIISNNYLFKKKNLYVCKIYLNKKINNTNNYNTYHENIFYIDSNESLINNYNHFIRNNNHLDLNDINNKGYLYLEKIENNPLHLNDNLYFFQLFSFMRIKNNVLELYLYNYDYYIELNYSLDTYNVNYINGYFGFFNRTNIEIIREQCKKIIISIIDLYGKYVENNNGYIDLWKFVFSIDKNYNIKLYDYNRFNNNIFIFLKIKENKNQYLYNDLLTNINNSFINKQDINLILLKKYNLL